MRGGGWQNEWAGPVMKRRFQNRHDLVPLVKSVYTTGVTGRTTRARASQSNTPESLPLVFALPSTRSLDILNACRLVPRRVGGLILAGFRTPDPEQPVWTVGLRQTSGLRVASWRLATAQIGWCSRVVLGISAIHLHFLDSNSTLYKSPLRTTGLLALSCLSPIPLVTFLSNRPLPTFFLPQHWCTPCSGTAEERGCVRTRCAHPRLAQHAGVQYPRRRVQFTRAPGLGRRCSKSGPIRFLAVTAVWARRRGRPRTRARTRSDRICTTGPTWTS